MHLFFLCFFFFSSRRRHTRLQGDWSSDVCSSDLEEAAADAGVGGRIVRAGGEIGELHLVGVDRNGGPALEELLRSEERRVGKEWRSRWAPYQRKERKSSVVECSEGQRVKAVSTGE